MFTNNIGDGTLRTYLQSLNGELYYPISDNGNFIYSGMHIYYEATSPFYIDVYFFGGLYGTIYFQKVSDFGLSCNPIQCFTLTYDNAYTKLSNIYFVTPLVTCNINFETSNNPPFNSTIDMDDVPSMTLLLKELYGQSVNYTYVDNGNGSSTITIDKMLNWSGMNQIDIVITDGSTGADFSLIPC